MARPSIFTEELAKDICARIAEGESVRSIARDNEMPTASTIFKWRLDIDTFSEQYDNAKDIGLEVRAEEIEEIAEEHKDVQRAKLIIDTKKWNMSKLKPKRFGDKMDVTSDGKALPTPILNYVHSDNSNKETTESEETN